MKPLTIAAGGLLILPAFASCQPEKPNVIFVMTDDQGYGDFGFTGNPIVQTPNVDAFAAQSINFSNYHTGTTSTPTRGGLLTGRNCNRNGTWHTFAGCSILNLREKTFGEYFQEAGYTTGMFGKWHLGDAPDYEPGKRGFDEVVCHKGGGIGQTPGYWTNDYMDDVYYHNGEPQQYKGYCTDVFFEEALKFIKNNRKKPFLCYLSLNAPHSPWNVPEEYYNLYKDETEIMESQKRFYGMVTDIDENFGRLLQRLEEWGLDKNTIVIFTTDNGTHGGYMYDRKRKRQSGFNAGMKGTKCSQYEGGHRVPFLLRWPAGGYGGGRVYDGLSAHVDVLPTLASMTGIPFEPVHELDGMDISSFIRTGEEADRILVTDTQRNQWPEKGRKSCVMKSHWRLVNGDELYDVSIDPGQKDNIIDQYPEVAAELASFYDSWWEKASQDFSYSYIDIHPDRINRLNCHDIHSDSMLPWSQQEIRNGKLSGPGYFCLDVKESGDYQLSLRRWPSETGLPLSAAIPSAFAGSISWDRENDGVPMTFASAYVEVDGVRYDVVADNSRESIDFIVPMKAGRSELKTVLVLPDGTETNAFYTDITKQ